MEDIKGCFLSLLGMAMSLLFSIGGIYWLWMAIQLGSFWMFFWGVFPFTMVITVPVGSYSFIFGMPEWVAKMFG
jgi:hypothetical protein